MCNVVKQIIKEIDFFLSKKTQNFLYLNNPFFGTTLLSFAKNTLVVMVNTIFALGYAS